MKKIEIFLLIAVCALSFVCYKQHKKIDYMENNISYWVDKIESQEDRTNHLESQITEMGFSISSLQEEMEEHFPRPQKTFAEKRQDYIDEINHFNAAREQEEKQGIKNTDKRINGLREWYRFIKKTYNIDIEIK